MTARIFGAKLWWLPLTAGCVKRQLPASSSRVRHNGQRVPPAVLAPVSICFIVIMLKPATYTPKKQYLVCLWWLIIPHKLFWWRQITFPALTGHKILRAWRRSSRTWMLHDEMCKATTFWWWFWTYYVVNTFHTTLFSHAIIGIDHGREGVTATTPSWFVVRRGRPESAGQQITRVLLP